MREIIPSTKFIHADVHKLTISCQRNFFWRYIMNLIINRFNINFWYGSVLGEGVEVLLQTKNIKKALKAMQLKHEELLKGQLLLPEQQEEVELQYKMLKTIIKVWYDVRRKYIDKTTIQEKELSFSIRLKNSPVIFEGILDGKGEYENKPTMFEIKTAASQFINQEYFSHLLFDKQINGYCKGIKKSCGTTFEDCHYLVFRKPSIYVRKAETPDEFVERFEEDLIERADWYFILYKHKFGKNAVEEVIEDIEAVAFDLYAKFSFLSKEELLNPKNWPRNDQQCFNYGVCPYFILCKKVKNFLLYSRSYVNRELRYSTEEAELDTEIVLSNKVKIKNNKKKLNRKNKK